MEDDGGIWIAEEGTIRLFQQYAVPAEGREYTTEQVMGALRVLNSRVWRNVYDAHFPTFLLDINRPDGEIPPDVHSVTFVTLRQLVEEWERLSFREKCLRTLEQLVILETRGRPWPTISNELWAGDPTLLARTRLNDGLAYASSDLEASKVHQKNAQQGWIRTTGGERVTLYLTPEGFEVADSFTRVQDKPPKQPVSLLSPLHPHESHGGERGSVESERHNALQCTMSDVQNLRPHPKAFISYAWESDAHKEWVRDLATRLRTDGVETILDQWEVHPGDQLPEFMERAVRENDYVLVVCTPRYKARSDARLGGVGYEGDIMTAEVFAGGTQRKFIPLLAEGVLATSLPTWLQGKYYIDLSQRPYDGTAYEDLLTTLHGTRPIAPPVIARRRPSEGGGQVQEPARPAEVRIVGIIADEVTEPRMDGTRGSALYTVPFQLSATPSNDWAEVFVHTWNRPPSFTTMHRPGIASVLGDRIILNGTTIDEVAQYHKKTLQLCIRETNRIIAEHEERQRQQADRERLKSESQRQSVRDAARAIDFDE